MPFTADEFKAGLERALEIVKLEREPILQVADDEKTLPIGLAIVAIAGLLTSLPAFPFGLVIGPLFTVAGSFIGVGLFYLVGVMFGVKWDFMRLYRAMSYTYLISWAGIVNIIPLLGQLIALGLGIYQMVVSVIVVETVGEVERGKAIAIVLIPLVVCCAIGAVLMTVFGVALAGLLAGAAQQVN